MFQVQIAIPGESEWTLQSFPSLHSMQDVSVSLTIETKGPKQTMHLKLTEEYVTQLRAALLATMDAAKAESS